MRSISFATRQTPGEAARRLLQGLDASLRISAQAALRLARKLFRDRPPARVCLAPDADADAGEAPPDYYLPIRKVDLSQIIGAQVGDPSELERVFSAVDSHFHAYYRDHLERLKNRYAHFDPDCQAPPLAPIASTQRAELADSFVDELAFVLERANFRELSREELDLAFGGASEWGIRLHVDFEMFAQLKVFTRGEAVRRRERRSWKTLFRSVIVEAPVFRRLVVVFRGKDHKRLPKDIDTNAVYLKMFKDIPKMDLDMLLPGTRVRMTMADRGKIILPTVSGAVVALAKVVKTTILATMFTGFWGLITFLMFAAGMIGYAIRSIFGYVQTHNNYQLYLTRHLYDQSLGNNAGVLTHLLSEAEDQEVRETMLAYALLLSDTRRQDWTVDGLAGAAERYLHREANLTCRFEAEDAVDKLLRLGMARRNGQGILVAKRPVELLACWASEASASGEATVRSTSY